MDNSSLTESKVHRHQQADDIGHGELLITSQIEAPVQFLK